MTMTMRDVSARRTTTKKVMMDVVRHWTNFFFARWKMDKELITPIIIAVVVLVVTAALFFFSKKKKVVALDSETWIPFPLTEVITISHDVKKFRFSLQTPKTVLGLPVGQHIVS